MKNSSQPIQKQKYLTEFSMNMNTLRENEFELGPNEFNDNKDKIGLFHLDPEVHNFLSIEKETFSA